MGFFFFLPKSNSPRNCGVQGFGGVFLYVFSSVVLIMDGGNFALPVCRLKRAVSWPLSTVAR